jgi:hypothetical protein
VSFVAQPYERFVDDLLVALTGGTIREEHEFVGVDQAYAVGNPGVIADSMRISGQRDGVFALFGQGVDYRYDATQQAILWETHGRPPDDHTFFYVSYAGEEDDRRLTDRNPGSVTSTLAEAFARQFAVLHKQMQMIYESAFVDLATGPALDHIAALLALTRKDAKFAGGEVLFKRSTPAPADISIPAGTVVSTDAGQNFETTDKRTLRRDQLSVLAPIRALVEGTAGRVDAGQIVTVNRPIFGIESVQNERATFFATERETDEELRRRIRGSLERAGRSTVDSIRQSLIEDVPELTEANVALTEQQGLVELRLGIEGGSDPDLVRRVEGSIFTSRPAGVRVRHNLGGETAAPEPGAAQSRPQVVSDFRAVGAPEPVATVGPSGAQAADAVLPLRVEVLIRIAQQNLSAAERETIADNVRTVVAEYIGGVAMGATLVYNKLLGRIVAAEEIADVALLVGPRDGTTAPSYRANLESPGAKVTVAPADIAVELMEQVVRIAVRVQLEPNPSAPAAADATAPPQVTDALRMTVRTAIEGALAAAAGTLRRDDIRSAIVAALGGPASSLILTERNGLVVNATYEETGRLINNTEEVALAEHEVAALGDLAVDIPDVLDG